MKEGVAGLAIERRGTTRKVDNPNNGRPRKKPLIEPIDSNLIAENQRLKEQNQYLEMENAYLKN